MFDTIRRFATFKGRAARKEFWIFQLYYVLGQFTLVSVSYLFLPLPNLGSSPLALPLSPLAFDVVSGIILMIFLGLVILKIGVHIRRLHDINMSGWWYLLFFWFGILFALILGLIPGTKRKNRFDT
jgi:uncharacterized membrane protein YhaH (DUF805 family)